MSERIRKKNQNKGVPFLGMMRQKDRGRVTRSKQGTERNETIKSEGTRLRERTIGEAKGKGESRRNGGLDYYRELVEMGDEGDEEVE